MTLGLSRVLILISSATLLLPASRFPHFFRVEWIINLNRTEMANYRTCRLLDDKLIREIEILEINLPGFLESTLLFEHIEAYEIVLHKIEFSRENLKDIE